VSLYTPFSGNKFLNTRSTEDSSVISVRRVVHSPDRHLCLETLGTTTILVLLLAALLTPSSFAQLSSGGGSLQAAASHDYLWLHTSGSYIYDQNNQIISLHGANIQFGAGQGFTMSDIDNLKGSGFDTIRMPVYWGLVQPYDESSNGIDQSYFTAPRSPSSAPSLDAVVNQALQDDTYVIIILAWTPTWGPPSWAFRGISGDSQRYATLINGTASKERTGIVNTWKYIANRYGNFPNVIFELLNEPNVADTSLAGNSYKAFNEQIISAIESAEIHSHLKMVELLTKTSTWEEILSGSVDINKSNVVWATHHYAPMNNWDPNGRYYHGSFTWQGQNYPEGWGNGTIYVAWRVIQVANQIHSWSKPWMITEFSKDTTQTYWAKWLNVFLSLQAEESAAGWVFHCYAHDPQSESGWNINNPTTQQNIMSYLRPYLSTLTVKRRT